MAFNVTGYATVSDIQQGEPGEASPQHANQRFWRSSSSSQVGVTVSARINWSTGAYDNITSGWSTTAPTAGATGTTVAYFADINFNDSSGLATHTTATGTGQRFINFSGVVTFTSNGNITDGTSSQAFGNLADHNTVAIANEVTGAGNLATNNSVAIANEVTGAGNLAQSNVVLGNLADHNTVAIANEVTGAGDLAIANGVNASNQVNGAGNLITANAVNLSNQTNSTVAIANQVSGAGGLATQNNVTLANQTNDGGALSMANAVNATNQVNGAGNFITANAANLANETNGTLQNNKLNANVVTGVTTADNSLTLAMAGGNNAAVNFGNGNGNGNSNLSNDNVSITASAVNDFSNSAMTAANAVLAANNNLTSKGNTGELFAPTTVIDGGQITTGLINTQFLFIDSALALSGANSGFIAGRTSLSDFGTDGFYIGRTSADGTTPDGFQLSHTSTTSNDSIGAAAPYSVSPSDTGTLNGINIDTGDIVQIRSVHSGIPSALTVDFRPIGGPLVDSQDDVGIIFTATGDGTTVASASFVGITLLEAGPLQVGTVQGVIHDDKAGLRIYEPIFYQRGNSAAGSDTILTNSGNITLSAGDIHTITLIGGGGGGGGGTPATNSNSTASLPGNAGGTTTANLSGYSAGSYNGLNSFLANGGSGGLPGLPNVSGTVSGEDSSFGPGGTAGGSGFGAGSNGTAGGNAPNTSYGAGGGGGGGAGGDFGFNNNPGGTDPRAGHAGIGGSAGQETTVTIDLTNSNNDATLAVSVGARGNGGNGTQSGGHGRQGTAAASDVLDGYNAVTLTDLMGGGYTYVDTVHVSNGSPNLSVIAGDVITPGNGNANGGNDRDPVGWQWSGGLGQVGSTGNHTISVRPDNPTNSAWSVNVLRWRQA